MKYTSKEIFYHGKVNHSDINNNNNKTIKNEGEKTWKGNVQFLPLIEITNDAQVNLSFGYGEKGDYNKQK